MTAKEPINTFIIYAREDKEIKKRLLAHLNPLKNFFNMVIWHDEEIEAGEEWEKKINARLEITDLFLMLISIDFLNSEFINQIEFKQAIERHKSNKSIVIPIIIKPCQWDFDFDFNTYTFSLTELQVLPFEGRPIDDWKTAEEAYNNIAAGIRKTLATIRKEKQERETEKEKQKKFEEEIKEKQKLIGEQLKLEQVKKQKQIEDKLRLKEVEIEKQKILEDELKLEKEEEKQIIANGQLKLKKRKETNQIKINENSRMIEVEEEPLWRKFRVVKKYRKQVIALFTLVVISICLWIWINEHQTSKANSALKNTFSSDKKVFPILDTITKKWGLKQNATKELIIPYRFESVDSMIEGILRVYENQKFGFVDSLGNIIVQAKYDWASRFHNGLARVKLNGKMGFIDKTGNEVISLKYYYAHNFSEGLAVVTLNDSDIYTSGYIDKSGMQIIPFYRYVYAGDFHEGLARVEGLKEYYYINKSNNIIYTVPFFGPIALNDEQFKFSEGLISVSKYGKNTQRFYTTSGFADSQGKLIIPIKYEDVESFSEGLAPVQLNNKWGFIDKTGKTVFPFVYDKAKRFSEGLALVKFGEKYGFINKEGGTAIPFVYDDAGSFSDGLARISINHLRGYIDKTGKIIIPPKYEWGYDFSEGYASVALNGAYGVINKAGQLIVSFRYGDRVYIEEGLFKAQLGNRWIYIDKMGKELN